MGAYPPLRCGISYTKRCRTGEQPRKGDLIQAETMQWMILTSIQFPWLHSKHTQCWILILKKSRLTTEVSERPTSVERYGDSMPLSLET